MGVVLRLLVVLWARAGHTTSSRWVLSISAISTPLNGAVRAWVSEGRTSER